MKEVAPYALLLVAVLSAAIWWQMTVWRECRTDHSFMYCLTLINGK